MSTANSKGVLTNFEKDHSKVITPLVAAYPMTNCLFYITHPRRRQENHPS